MNGKKNYMPVLGDSETAFRIFPAFSSSSSSCTSSSALLLFARSATQNCRVLCCVHTAHVCICLCVNVAVLNVKVYYGVLIISFSANRCIYGTAQQHNMWAVDACSWCEIYDYCIASHAWVISICLYATHKGIGIDTHTHTQSGNTITTMIIIRKQPQDGRCVRGRTERQKAIRGNATYSQNDVEEASEYENRNEQKKKQSTNVWRTRMSQSQMKKQADSGWRGRSRTR